MNLQTQRDRRVNWLAIGLVLLVTFLIGNFAVSAETNAVADFSTSTLEVDKSDAKPDQTLNYTLSVINDGGDGSNVTATNTLPAGMSYNESAQALENSLSGQDGIFTQSLTINGRTMTWSGSVTAGKQATIEFSADVPASATIGSTITNNAEIEHSTGDKSLSASTNVVDAAPDISTSTFTVDKDKAKVDDTLEYTLIVNNSGDTGAVDVTDVLPTQVTFVPNSFSVSTQGTVFSNAPALSNGTITWEIPQISFNATATLKFEVTVNSNVPLNTNIVNTINVDAGTSIVDIPATTQVVEFTSLELYLPVVSKPFAAPVLSVTDVDQNGDDSEWTLSWSSPFTGNGEAYRLQEATNESFTENLVNINKTTRSHEVSKDTSEAEPTYYYRVALTTGAGSFFSNVVEVELSGGLSIDKTVIDKSKDECTTLRWDFTGITSFAVNYAHGFDKREGNGQGKATVCPSIDTTYTAEIKNTNGTIERFSVSVDVIGSGCNRDPYVERFEPTALLVNNGDNITFFYDFECASEGTYKIGEGPEFGASSPGSVEFRITGDTLFKLKVIKRDGDNKIVFEDNASFTVEVR